MNYVKASQRAWTTRSCLATDREVEIGCLQRIAAATELLARDRENLLVECDQYKSRYQLLFTDYQSLTRSNASLRGVITKLRKALGKEKP